MLLRGADQRSSRAVVAVLFLAFGRAVVRPAEVASTIEEMEIKYYREAVPQRFLRRWGQVHGLIMLDVFGHLSWESEDASDLYPACMLHLVNEINALAARVNTL